MSELEVSFAGDENKVEKCIASVFVTGARLVTARKIGRIALAHTAIQRQIRPNNHVRTVIFGLFITLVKTVR